MFLWKVRISPGVFEIRTFLVALLFGSDGVYFASFWITTIELFEKGTNFDRIIKNSYFFGLSWVVLIIGRVVVESHSVVSNLYLCC